MSPRARKLLPIVAAIASGLLLTLAFPPFDLAWTIWIWQAPLLVALWFSGGEKKRARRGFGLAYLTGITFFTTSLSWFIETGKTVDSTATGVGIWLVISVYLAVYFGLWGAFATTVGRWRPEKNGEDAKRPGFDPGDLFGSSLAVLRIACLNGAAWCGLEWIRGWFLTGFSWNGLGVALHDSIVLIQCVDLIGVTGLSWVIVFCNVVAICTLVRLVREMLVRRRIRPHLDFAAAAALIILMSLYGVSWTYRPMPEDTVEVKTLVVQMNIPIDEKWDLDNSLKILTDYYEFTAAFTSGGDYDLVIWPETAIPGRFTYPFIQTYFNERVLKIDDFHFLTGVEEEEELGEILFNAMVLSRGSTADYQSYRKTKLVPFGEFLPFRDSPVPLTRWLGGDIITKDFTPGTSFDPLQLDQPDVQIIPLICFEDSMSGHARKFVRKGEPQLMVNVTNDGWFWESAQSEQHLNHAKFRCIEIRRPMARAANTGVSAVIDEIGSLYDRHSQGAGGRRIIEDSESGSTFIRGAFSGVIKVPRDGPVTFFAKYGDVFSILMAILATLALVIRWLRQRGESRV